MGPMWYIEDQNDGSFLMYQAGSAHTQFFSKKRPLVVTYACKDRETALELIQILTNKCGYAAKHNEVYIEVAAVVSGEHSSDHWRWGSKRCLFFHQLHHDTDKAEDNYLCQTDADYCENEEDEADE